MISRCYSPPSSWPKRFKNFRPLLTHKTTFWSANYSACVVHTKTIIHLHFGFFFLLIIFTEKIKGSKRGSRRAGPEVGEGGSIRGVQVLATPLVMLYSLRGRLVEGEGKGQKDAPRALVFYPFPPLRKPTTQAMLSECQT